MTETHYRYTETDPAIEAKVADLLGQMTLEEKVGQLIQVGSAPGGSERYIALAAGRVGSVLAMLDVAEVNRCQKAAIETSRLGIPMLVGNDVIHGLRTTFPIPLAESCSWDLDLMERTAAAAAREAAAVGTNWIFAPMVDIARDGRWGRIAEGSGEDTYLGCEIARARIRGFQTKDLEAGKKIMACPKHFVAYGAAEAGRDYNTVDVSENTLRDVYLPPFAAAFDEGAATVMSAFNEINGVPATCNSFILQTILREEWNWSGVVLSDAMAVKELIDHGTAADMADAGAQAINAGVDIDMGAEAYLPHLAELVESGRVPIERVDEAVTRVLRLKFELGLFENPFTDESLHKDILLCDEHRRLAGESARKSMVLLKNDQGLLPILPEVRRIAVIGPLADDSEAPLGCWFCEGKSEDVVTVLDGIIALAPQGCEVSHCRGCDIDDDDTAGFADAMSTAAAADVAVMVLGESRDMSGEAQCRAHLDLPGIQQALVEAIAATGTPIVAVVLAGRPLTLEDLGEDASAILYAWHGGVETGRAAAELLFGYANPSGKLTASFPRNVGQLPVYYAHKSTGRPAFDENSEEWDSPFRSRYRDSYNSPLYPFGYGLSYTTYVYDRLQVLTPEARLDGTVRVCVEVTNTGKVDGDEIAQLYVRDLVASMTRPVKELKGFQRIHLEPGEARTLEFEVPVQSLGFTNAKMEYVVEPGEFEVFVGPSSAEGLRGKFTVVE